MQFYWIRRIINVFMKLCDINGYLTNIFISFDKTYSVELKDIVLLQIKLDGFNIYHFYQVFLDN